MHDDPEYPATHSHVRVAGSKSAFVGHAYSVHSDAGVYGCGQTHADPTHDPLFAHMRLSHKMPVNPGMQIHEQEDMLMYMFVEQGGILHRRAAMALVYAMCCRIDS